MMAVAGRTLLAASRRVPRTSEMFPVKLLEPERTTVPTLLPLPELKVIL